MQKIRLLFLLSLVIAVSAPVAVAQEGAPGQDHSQAQSRDSKHNKKAKDNDGQRKHWWSLPHRHKQDKDSAARQSSMNSSSQPGVGKPASTPAAPASRVTAESNTSHRTASSTNPAHARTVSRHSARAKAAGTTPAHKAARTAHSRTKTVTAARAHNTSAHKKTARRKTVAHSTHAAKPAQHDCPPEEAQKGGCQADNSQNAKTTTRASR